MRRCGRGDAYHALLHRHVQVVAEHTEGLRDGLAVLRLRQELLIVLVVVPAWDITQYRSRQYILDVLTSANCLVHSDEEPEYASGDSQSKQECHGQDAASVGRNGNLPTIRIFHYAHVGIIDGQLQSILLTLVEQISVEGFLYLLLTSDIKCLDFRLRRSRHLRAQAVV